MGKGHRNLRRFALGRGPRRAPGIAERATPPTPCVRLITDPADFMAMGPPWNAIVAAMSSGRLFLYHEWFDAAWRWRQQTARLWLLCLFRDQKLRAVLPLVLADTT